VLASGSWSGSRELCMFESPCKCVSLKLLQVEGDSLICLIVWEETQVKSVFGARMFALGVVVKVPVPKHTAKANFQVTSGRAKYNAALDCLVWK